MLKIPKIREVEHLPASEREEIFKRCVASEEMLRYRKMAPKLCGLAILAAEWIFLFALLREPRRLPLPSMILLYASGTVMSIILILIAKLTRLSQPGGWVST
jgi:hypothetical protein